MRPKYDERVLIGWVLATDDGSLLYRGNPNVEFKDLRLGSFGYEGIIGAMPINKATKWEAQEVAKVWNGLRRKSLEGHVGSDGRPLPCIDPKAIVHPVKVKITIGGTK
jgi:hypothetical protein